MVLDIANVGLLLTLVGCVVGFLTYNLAKKKEDKQEIKEDSSSQTRLEMQLEYIKQGVDDIKLEMRDMKTDAKAQDEKINSLIEKVARIEESEKSAHKRLNELEQRINESERK